MLIESLRASAVNYGRDLAAAGWDESDVPGMAAEMSAAVWSGENTPSPAEKGELEWLVFAGFREELEGSAMPLDAGPFVLLPTRIGHAQIIEPAAGELVGFLTRFSTSAGPHYGATDDNGVGIGAGSTPEEALGLSLEDTA